MAQINPADGSIVDTGVARESGAHEFKESVAHQRSAVPSISGNGISLFVGWNSNWATSWTYGAELAAAPSTGDTSVTVKYYFGNPPGSNGGTTTIGLGVGMTVRNATGANTWPAGTVITSISGLVVNLSHPNLGGGSIDITGSYSGLANSIYPTNWDACLMMNSEAGYPLGGIQTWLNYDALGTFPGDNQLYLFSGGSPGGSDSGTLDSAGYELFNAPSKFTVTFTGGTSYGWAHDSGSSLYTIVYPATTNGPSGPVNSYLFDFGASVTLSSKQVFSPGNYTGGLNVSGTSVGTNSTFAGSIIFGDITVSFDLTSGFSCPVAGIVTSNTGSTAAGWSCDFNQVFTGAFALAINMNNMSFDATFGKANINQAGIKIQLTS